MPPDELHVAQFRPINSEQKLERGGRANIDSKRSNAGKSMAKAVDEEGGIGIRRDGEETMTPRREEREVEVGDIVEAVREEMKVTRVAAQREGGASPPFDTAEAAADEGESVASASVRNSGEYDGEDLIGKVRETGGVCSGHRSPE